MMHNPHTSQLTPAMRSAWEQEIVDHPQLYVFFNPHEWVNGKANNGAFHYECSACGAQGTSPNLLHYKGCEKNAYQ